MTKLKQFLERKRRVWPVFDRNSQKDGFYSKPIKVLLKKREFFFEKLNPYFFIWEVLDGMVSSVIGLSRFGEFGKVVKSIVADNESHGLPITLLDKIYYLGRCMADFRSGIQIQKFKSRNKNKNRNKNNEKRQNWWNNVRNKKSENQNNNKQMNNYGSIKKNNWVGNNEKKNSRSKNDEKRRNWWNNVRNKKLENQNNNKQMNIYGSVKKNNWFGNNDNKKNRNRNDEKRRNWWNNVRNKKSEINNKNKQMNNYDSVKKNNWVGNNEKKKNLNWNVEQENRKNVPWWKSKNVNVRQNGFVSNKKDDKKKDE